MVESQPLPSGRGVRLEFEDIRYDVTIRSGRCCRKVSTEKQILRGISGVVEPGDLVALMGASGAGKTTLLNVLSRQLTGNTGSICIDGQDVQQQPDVLKKIAFIQQEDEFFGLLTVAEHLEQQADLRIAAAQPEKQQRVADVLAQFSLTKSQNSRIGNVLLGAGRGISGGEKKRLSVATELLANPPLIFADEPTSGLDAFMAESVVLALRQLAEAGHSIVCTIHQPASDVFRMFNKVMLLAEGQVIFYGPRLAAIPYFMRLGRPCPAFTNPADFFIDELAINWDDPDEDLQRISTWAAEWRAKGANFLAEYEKTMRAELEESEKKEIASDMALTEAAGANTNGGKQMRGPAHHYSPPEGARVPLRVVWVTLLRRTILSTARDPLVVRARMVQIMVTALFNGLIYLRLAKNAWYSRLGAAVNLMITLAFVTVFSCILPILNEKRLIKRERDAGLYRLGTYISTKIFADTIFQIHLPVMFVTIFWWMSGMNDKFTRYLLGLLFVWLMAMAAASMGYIIGCTAPNFGVAVALGPLLILATVMTCGFIYSVDTIPKPWIWLYYISPFSYGFSGLMRAVFLDEHLGPPPPDSVTPYTEGNQVLENFHISTTKGRWTLDILILLAWTIFGRLIAAACYCYCNRRRVK